MGLIGSGMGLLAVTYSKPPAEHLISRIARSDVLLSLVRAPALPPQHADFGSQFHTPSNRCLRFAPRVTTTPARLAPFLPACSALDGPDFHWQAHSSFPIAPRIRLSDKTSRLRFRVQRLLQFLNTRGVDRLPNPQVLHHVLRLS